MKLDDRQINFKVILYTGYWINIVKYSALSHLVRYKNSRQKFHNINKQPIIITIKADVMLHKALIGLLSDSLESCYKWKKKYHALLCRKSIGSVIVASIINTPKGLASKVRWRLQVFHVFHTKWYKVWYWLQFN